MAASRTLVDPLGVLASAPPRIVFRDISLTNKMNYFAVAPRFILNRLGELIRIFFDHKMRSPFGIGGLGFSPAQILAAST